MLWLFTDANRMANPLPAIARLPPGLCGVVFRHDDVPGRGELAASVAALCRRRRITLAIAGDWRLAARHRAWVHRRAGQAGPPRGSRRTASAHDGAELARALKTGAVVFLSPVFPTSSHPGARGLGTLRWAALARRNARVLALGGIDGVSVKRLSAARPAGAGAIGALGATRPAS